MAPGFLCVCKTSIMSQDTSGIKLTVLVIGTLQIAQQRLERQKRMPCNGNPKCSILGVIEGVYLFKCIERVLLHLETGPYRYLRLKK